MHFLINPAEQMAEFVGENQHKKKNKKQQEQSIGREKKKTPMQKSILT